MIDFTPEQINALKAPLSQSVVKQREQVNTKLDYIEAWHAIAEANRIFGFDAWDRETVEVRCVMERERKVGKGQWQKDGWGVTYIARVRIRVNHIVREGCGSGHGIDADLGLAHESAIKEAESDAMKRALMTFGNPFGLALYDKARTNVEPIDAPANDAPAKKQDKPASAHHMRKEIEEQIRKDLLDAKSKFALDKLFEDCRAKAEKEKWAQDWWAHVLTLFRARSQEIQAQDDAVTQIKNEFPGARVTNEHVREQHFLEAGQ